MAQLIQIFLKEYYSSIEKSQGASKIVYALLKGNRSIAIKLIENGENLNENSTNKNILTALMIAIDSEDEGLTELMIKNKVDINVRWYYDFYNDKKNLILLSPLELAIHKNIRSNIVLMLVKCGALVQNTNGWGKQDALMLSISQGDAEKFFAIVENATAPFDIKAIYDTGMNLLMTSCVYPESNEHKKAILKIYQYLIDSDVAFETTKCNALSNAIIQGNMPLLELLISSGANVHHIPALGSIPIFSAISYNISYNYMNPCYREFVAQPTEALTMLLELGVSQDVFTSQSKDQNSGFSPLGYAMHFIANEAALKLIEYGAQLDAKDKFEQTPLIRAINSNNFVGVELLLEFGANIHIKSNKETRKQRRVACWKRNIMKFI